VKEIGMFCGVRASSLATHKVYSRDHRFEGVKGESNCNEKPEKHLWRLFRSAAGGTSE
jgi:hypothetical protein